MVPESKAEIATQISGKGRPIALSPSAHLVEVAKRYPDIVDERDAEGVARLASQETLIIAATERFQQIWNSVLKPDETRERSRSRMANAARVKSEAATLFSEFVSGLYDHFSDMTREAAKREAGAVAKILSSLKRGQRLRDAMTREQFCARFAELSAAKA